MRNSKNCSVSGSTIATLALDAEHGFAAVSDVILQLFNLAL